MCTLIATLFFFSANWPFAPRASALSCQCNLMPISLVTEKVVRCHHPLLLSYTFTNWKYKSGKNTLGLSNEEVEKMNLKNVATAGIMGKIGLIKMRQLCTRCL